MAALPRYRAQLATLVEAAPAGSEWLHELKYDGYRIACYVERGNVRLESRRNHDWTAQFPEIVAAASELSVRTALLDGEVAIVLSNGATSFQALQNAFSGGSRQGLTYFAFDLLHLDGKDVAVLPLEQRKQLCEQLLRRLPSGSAIRYSQHFDTDGPAVLHRACALGAEGIVSKRRDRPYRGGRNAEWLKIKCAKRQEFVVGGFTEPEGSRAGIGALLMGHYEGDSLRFAGKVGTGRGFTAEYLRRVRRELDALEQEECPFVPRPPASVGRHARWVKPVRVGEVVFAEWTEGGNIRHGSFQGFRDDKRARDVVREGAAPPAPPKPPVTSRARSESVPSAAAVRGVSITTPERPVYPELGFTKLDLARLYSDLADWILPYVENRPLTLVRCEKGVRKSDALRSECKFLRHEPGWHRWVKEPIRRVQIREQKKVGEYLVIDSPEGLISLIQGDIIEIHVWNATADRVEHPDRIVFDLDPGPDVEWSRVVSAARLLRDELTALGLSCWPKLTGGKGIHVVLPFQPEAGWDQVYAFARAVAESVVRRDPATFTLSFPKQGREKKILVDYKRNHRAAVAVAAYSTRAHPSGAIGVPVSWRELGPASSSDRWTVQNVRGRIRRLKTDPWKDMWRARQQLPSKI